MEGSEGVRERELPPLFRLYGSVSVFQPKPRPRVVTPVVVLSLNGASVFRSMHAECKSTVWAWGCLTLVFRNGQFLLLPQIRFKMISS